jgi:tryptophan-rich sensory protein
MGETSKKSSGVDKMLKFIYGLSCFVVMCNVAFCIKQYDKIYDAFKFKINQEFITEYIWHIVYIVIGLIVIFVFQAFARQGERERIERINEIREYIEKRR